MSVSEYRFGKVPDDGLQSLVDEIGQEIDGERSGPAIGWNGVSDAMGGSWRQGELTILAGPPGNGKSYLSLSACLHAHSNGSEWLYLPAEDRHTVWLRKMSAIAMCDWSMLHQGQASGVDRMRKIMEYKSLLDILSKRICENPRKPVEGMNGSHVPDMPHDVVVEWVRSVCDKADLIVIDPITMIDFAKRGTPEWEGQQKFIKDLVAVVGEFRSHVILVCHLSKSGQQRRQLEMDNVQGSAAFTRFAHNVLLLDAHDPKDSEVFSFNNTRKTVTHKRTLYLSKMRNGPGVGKRIAMDFMPEGPVLMEYGVICPK